MDLWVIIWEQGFGVIISRNRDLGTIISGNRDCDGLQSLVTGVWKVTISRNM